MLPERSPLQPPTTLLSWLFQCAFHDYRITSNWLEKDLLRTIPRESLSLPPHSLQQQEMKPLFTPEGPRLVSSSPQPLPQDVIISPAPSWANCPWPMSYRHWLPAIRCPLDFYFFTYFSLFSWHHWFLTLWQQQPWLSANAALGCDRQPHSVAFLDAIQVSRAYLSLSINVSVDFCFLGTTIKENYWKNFLFNCLIVSLTWLFHWCITVAYVAKSSHMWLFPSIFFFFPLNKFSTRPR